MSSTFFNSYVETAFWSSTDNADESGGEPLDKNYSKNDIAPETLAKMAEDCAQFVADNANALETIAEICDDSKAGHLFWLNRNGHGSGFWDLYNGNNATLREAVLQLSNASKAGWGTFDLYVGDDGKIYGS